MGLLFATACNKSTNSSTPSSNVAQLTTFSFAANDSFPGLAAAKFTVKELIDTGYVYNEDSILFGTPLTKVSPKFTFVSTPSSALLTLPDTTVTLTGRDTLDFTRQPIYLTIKSQDGTATKTYRIEAFVHQVDPDLFVWKRLCDQVCAGDVEQQTLHIADRFVMITNNGFSNRVFSSSDAATWTALGEPNLLPHSCEVRNIVAHHDTLFYAKEQNLYSSVDGINWTSQDYASTEFFFHTVLMSFNDCLWAVVESLGDAQLYLAKMEQGSFAMTDMVLDENFPIGGFSSVVFQSASLRARAMILGGYSRDGGSQNSRWSFEYSHIEDAYRMQNFTIEQPRFTTLTGSSMVWYGNELYLFGGINADAMLQDVPFLVSRDEGMNWVRPDTAKVCLPAEYAVRQKQSALVWDNCIYLFAGQSRTETFSDVYRGRLNSIDW